MKLFRVVKGEEKRKLESACVMPGLGGRNGIFPSTAISTLSHEKCTREEVIFFFTTLDDAVKLMINRMDCGAGMDEKKRDEFDIYKYEIDDSIVQPSDCGIGKYHLGGLYYHKLLLSQSETGLYNKSILNEQPIPQIEVLLERNRLDGVKIHKVEDGVIRARCEAICRDGLEPKYVSKIKDGLGKRGLRKSWGLVDDLAEFALKVGRKTINEVVHEVVVK